MAEKVVLDTSVIVKWFLKEEGSDSAREFLLKFVEEDLEIIVPEIVVLELSNALWWSGKFSIVEVQRLVRTFFDIQLLLVQVDSDLIIRGLKYLQSTKLAIYDALFMALAEREGVALITADKKHHKRKYYGEVRYLENWS